MSRISFDALTKAITTVRAMDVKQKELLADEVIQDTSMDVSTLEGFLTAIAMSPDRAALAMAALGLGYGRWRRGSGVRG